jgi:acyl transferase domain-containing protein/2-polyprenyl-3-methyl-5-hydroxy-6-metoxy-1,4-benzoquinol methylase
MDPAQKQLLEVAYEAIESSGLTLSSLSGSLTGVYVGNFGLDSAVMSLKDAEYLNPYTSTGTGGTILSNRISYVFDLKGPSFTLDTACSSSFYALHLACIGLYNGDCEGALVCAPNAIRSIEAQLTSSKLGAISPTSQCHTFDASADGYARADGFGAVYVMKLSDAIKQGRPIRAVIRGTAIGANGHGRGLTHPEAEGQAAVIRKAYEAANISEFSQTGYFECHGTGTPVGDPIETSSVGSVFASSRPSYDPLLIGSVKSNLGHSEAAAGITALIKNVLAIEKKIIPPTIGVVNPNPAIKFDDWKLKIVTEATPWPSNIPFRRASVNSFGYGGANAHVILEGVDSVMPNHLTEGSLLTDMHQVLAASDSPGEKDSSDSQHSGDSSSQTTVSFTSDDDKYPESLPKLILCTAKNDLSLNKTIKVLKDLIITRPIQDIAYTLSYRSKFSRRAIALVKAGSEPIFNTGTVTEKIQLDFIFTGQGAQWPKMGKELMAFSIFRDSIRQIDRDLADLPMAPSWTVEEMLKADLMASEMDEPRVAQIMSIALEIAVVDLLADWNVVPTCVAGHSAGEIAAAYAAGYLTRGEAIAVAYYRGRAVSETEQLPGGMLAVGLSAEESEKLLPENGKVVIGAVNSPRSVTLSGDADAIQAIKKDLDDRKIFNRFLATKGRAYHSPYMENAAEAYGIPLHKIERPQARPKIRARYFSTVTGSLWTEDQIPMSYWRRNMESPVLFYKAISAMRESGMTHSLEIGPHSTLRSPILDIVKSIAADKPTPFTYLSSLKRNEDGTKSILTACSELALCGYDIDLNQINGKGSFLVDFPSYQWDHSRFLVNENRADREWRFRPYPRHDLLGSATPGTAMNVRIWRNVLSLNDIPWLADHKVGEHYIFPAAGFMSMAVEAMRQVRDGPSDLFVLEGMHIGAAMMVDTNIEVFLTMQKQALGDTTISGNCWQFNVSSVKDGISTEHAKGRISCMASNEHSGSRVLPTADMACSESILESRWYDEITQSKGLVFGPSFRRLSNISLEPKQHRASAQIKVATSPEMTGMDFESEYIVHPTVLDNCLQLSVLAAGTSESAQAFVPVSVDRLEIFEDRGAEKLALLECNGNYVGFKGLYGNAQLLDGQGKVMIGLHGLRFVGIPAGDDAGPARKREAFWRLVWDDDYDAITKDNLELYFPSEKYWPKQYDYPRKQRVYLTQMVIRQFSQKYPHLMTMEPVNTENKHFIEWAHWLLKEIKTEYPEMYNMTLEERGIEIEKERPLAPPGTEWSWALHENLHRIISGEMSVLDIATSNELLGKFYATQLIYDKFERAIEIMGFKNPDMKIIEIGAGTGSATELILKRLTVGGTKRYSSFTYTDISTSFFVHASAKFAQYEDIEYKLYDMEKDPEEQDYEPESFDLVIASCTVHVTANITNALKKIRKLLKPGGKILLSEITAEWHDQTFCMVGELISGIVQN